MDNEAGCFLVVLLLGTIGVVSVVTPGIMLALCELNQLFRGNRPMRRHVFWSEEWVVLCGHFELVLAYALAYEFFRPELSLFATACILLSIVVHMVGKRVRAAMARDAKRKKAQPCEYSDPMNCLSCEALIPPSADRCPHCGWSWKR
jgi:NhaP-type Na+/H+ or K+/H+ antiporter